LLGLPLVALAATKQQEGTTDMQSTTVRQEMSSEQQAQLFRLTKIGLSWVAGQMSFEDITRSLGQPEYQNEQADLIKYAYYPKGMAVYFVLDKLHLVDGKPSIDFFRIKVDDSVRTDIPYAELDSLGLHRVVRGELIDGLRTEPGDFFAPTGIADVSRFYPKNYVGFTYRMPLSPDSLFDVYAGFGYLGQWINENGTAVLSNFRNAIDLRDLGVSRHYLTPDELEQRRLAKRRKYGEMNLCTGMLCPETGLLEGWTENGATDMLVVRKGDAFQVGRLSNNVGHRDWYRFANARWMWLNEYEDG
jgi:hypothetical protein